LRNVDVLIEECLKKDVVDIHLVDLVAHEAGVGEEKVYVFET